MLKRVTPILVLSALAGCSSAIDQRQANGSDAYLQAQATESLMIPVNLSEPKYSGQYTIPTLDVAADKTLVGNKLDIRPPLQILPLAEGTHVEQGADNIKVVIESVNNGYDLKQEIYDYLVGFLAAKNINTTRSDIVTGVIETDWIPYEQVIDSNLFGEDQVYKMQQRYRFSLEMSPHGRTGKLVIDLIDNQIETPMNTPEIFLSGEDKRRYTIDMLNSAVMYISQGRETVLAQQQQEQSRGIETSFVGEEPAYFIANAEQDQVWNRLQLVLPELGFEVTDLDRSIQTLYVDYGDNVGFWGSMFGSETLDLEEGRYQVQLFPGTNNQQTRIAIKQLDGEAIALETLQQLSPIFIEEMGEDRNRR